MELRCHLVVEYGVTSEPRGNFTDGYNKMKNPKYNTRSRNRLLRDQSPVTFDLWKYKWIQISFKTVHNFWTYIAKSQETTAFRQPPFSAKVKKQICFFFGAVLKKHNLATRCRYYANVGVADATKSIFLSIKLSWSTIDVLPDHTLNLYIV